MDDPKLVSESILSLIVSSPKKSLLGSDLALLLRLKHPAFKATDHGCRNLREFVRHHVPTVYEAGRHGLDVAYAPSPVVQVEQTPALAATDTVRAQSAEPQRRDLEVDAEVWKTYVSPNSRYRLYINPESLSARVVDAHSAPPSAPWIVVPPCPVAKHLDIARQFIETVSDQSHRERLRGLLSEEIWWVPFFSLARTLNLGKDWAAFRSRQLVAELRRTLDDLGIRLPSKARLGLEGASWSQPLRSTAPRRRTDNLLRRLAQGAISQMSEAELRLLKLPLGDVVDQLGEDR